MWYVYIFEHRVEHKSGKKELDSSFKSKVVQILQSFDMLKR